MREPETEPAADGRAGDGAAAAPAAPAVRAAAGPDLATVYDLTARVFPGDPAPPDAAALAPVAARWRRRIEAAAAAHPVHVRVAVAPPAAPDAPDAPGAASTIVGSDVLYERELRLGPRGAARLRTACIGVVLAHPERRRAGVGRALMGDAIRFARERGFPLLLLGGIPDFYHRFGYADVMERAAHAIEAAQLAPAPGEPVAGVAVRPATAADAPALLALYERHYGARPGGFHRSLGWQRSLLAAGPGETVYLIAHDAGGAPCAYACLRETEPARAIEAGAGSWPGALALLRAQAALVAARGEPGSTLTWHVPPGRETYFHLADHLLLTTEMRSRPSAGWLARPAHLPALFDALAPALAARWTERGGAWTGALHLAVAGDAATDQPAGACTLRLTPAGCDVAPAGAAPPPGTTPVRLAPSAFTQLVFGFRPLSWIARRPGCALPARAHPARAALATLFPARPAWIAGSDHF